MLRFNKIYLRKHVSLSVLVVQTDGGEHKVDLTAAKVDHADKKSLLEVAQDMQTAIDNVRQRRDKALEESKTTIKKILLGIYIPSQK